MLIRNTFNLVLLIGTRLMVYSLSLTKATQWTI